MKRVLVADDDSVVRGVIARALKDLGVSEVVCASDGKEALDLLLSNTFDLVMLDWNMPGLNGLEVVRKLREHGSRVPVMMVTAESGKGHVLEAIAAGVADYVVKPLDYQTLRLKLQGRLASDGDLVTVDADASLEDAAQSLLEHNLGALPVINDRHQFLGMITEAQVLHAALRPATDKRSIRDMMAREVVTAKPGIPLTTLLKMMVQRDLAQLPIVRDGQLVGIVSRRQLLRHILTENLLPARPLCAVPVDGGETTVPPPPGPSRTGSEFISIESYNEPQRRGVQRVLDTLDRLEDRTHELYAEMRKHPRHSVRLVVTVCIGGAVSADDGACPGPMFRAWATSLSPSGLAFVHPGPISQRDVLVGVPLSHGRLTWFRANVVREREVPGEEFWEIGVALRGRISRQPATTDPMSDENPQREAVDANAG